MSQARAPAVAHWIAAGVEPYKLVTVRTGTFLEHLPEIEHLAIGRTLFLYLDPFTVQGLE